MFQKLKNIYHLIQSFAANVYYGFPGRKMTIMGVTGTSGKTTTTLMIYHLLKEAGYKVSVLSTIKAVIGSHEYDTGFHVTTPDPWVLPKYLQKAVKDGDTHFVLEVSSHALDQNRAAFVPFAIGVLTSFAHEHLDYHKTLANYARAKFKLLHTAKVAIVPQNVFEHCFSPLANGEGESKGETVDTLKQAVHFEKLNGKMRTFGLTVGDETQDTWQLSLHLPGDINVMDGLAAASVGKALGIDKTTIKRALASFPGVPGRFESIPNDRGLRVIIDFAHKPDALEGAIVAARQIVHKNGRDIVMYGSASERDTLKRPIMGKISGELAEITVLTDEDPRYEEPMKILDEIGAGCLEGGAKELSQTEILKRAQDDKGHVLIKIPERREAIGFIINKLAKKGDVVLLCGKGHEQSMNYRGREFPWSEHKEVRKALESK